MYFVRSLRLLSKLSTLIWKIPTNEKEIYLTFDDGPVPEVTPKVLEVLAKYNVKATFFCVGENVKKYPEIFKMILDNGHAVGNHTFNHLDGWDVVSDSYVENVINCEKYFNTTMFRPPYGRIRTTQVIKLRKNYKIIMWSVLSGDFDKKVTPEKCLNQVLKNTKRGSIVVFHDSLKAQEKCLAVLPQFMDHFIQRGYLFKPLTREVCRKHGNTKSSS